MSASRSGDWSGKVVLVTGGSAGLGAALARCFAERGARVVITARDPERLSTAAEQIRAAGGDALGIPADITDDAQVEALLRETIAQRGKLDVLVNNVGRSSRGEAIATTPDEFRQLLELNFLTAVRCTRAAAPHLIESKGHAVNIGSLAAKAASRYLGAYPASKFPLAAYCQQLRFELGAQGVHVLLVCPGPIARADSGGRYDGQSTDLPESARKPGGGVKLKGIPPDKLARQILAACRRRQPELIVPGRARLLFAISQLSPALGDWIVRKMT